MNKNSLTFDQLPDYIFELGRKVDSLISLFSAKEAVPQSDEIGGLSLFCEVTGLSEARGYALVSQRKVPHAKRGNRLYFTRTDLLNWIAAGNRPTSGEEADKLPFGPARCDPASRRQQSIRTTK